MFAQALPILKTGVLRGHNVQPFEPDRLMLA